MPTIARPGSPVNPSFDMHEVVHRLFGIAPMPDTFRVSVVPPSEPAPDSATRYSGETDTCPGCGCEKRIEDASCGHHTCRLTTDVVGALIAEAEDARQRVRSTDLDLDGEPYEECPTCHSIDCVCNLVQASAQTFNAKQVVADYRARKAARAAEPQAPDGISAAACWLMAQDLRLSRAEATRLVVGIVTRYNDAERERRELATEEHRG